MWAKLIFLLAFAGTSYGLAQAAQPVAQDVSSGSSSAVPQSSASPTVQAITIGKFTLSLTGCQLTYEGLGKSGTIAFNFPSRCQFSRDSKGEIRVVKTGKTRTLLIESSHEADSPSGSQTKDCVTVIRGIVVGTKAIRLSVQTQKVAQCLPAVWDEKMFHVFAARTQAISGSRGTNP